MKVKAYVLIVMVALISMSAATKKTKSTVGVNPGDLAPRIESLGSENKIHFKNHSGRYTLLNFWAAYDAESRARNVKLSNEVNKLNSDKIAMYSISLDERKSIFTETVKADKLNASTQFHEEQGRASDLYRKYNLNKGLRNFLIDDKGVIIAANVTADELAKALKNI
ncbi:MAG: thioredoxin-like domain-containing protein [Tannerellaceae bacterium]